MRRAEPVAGLGGLVLLVSLFLTWYGVDFEVTGPQTGSTFGVAVEKASAWRWFSVIDVLLALAAVVAIAVPVVSALARGPARPIAIAVIASTVTPVAVLLVVFRMLFPPEAEGLAIDDLGLQLSLTPGLGAWLSLAGAVLAFVGAWFSLRDESTPGAVPPDVPRRPAPKITP
jgi:hypothetical protein